jgi:hypothetical protein
LTYICVKCQTKWKTNDTESIFSSGLCKKCLKESLTPLYRKRQLKEGNFDCFGRAGKTCNQEKCKYKDLCLNE